MASAISKSTSMVKVVNRYKLACLLMVWFPRCDLSLWQAATTALVWNSMIVVAADNCPSLQGVYVAAGHCYWPLSLATSWKPYLKAQCTLK